MATTTIRVEDELKARITAAAQRADKTPHAFMVDAIAQAVEQADSDDAFQRLADERWSEFLSTGETIGWADAKTWLADRMRGERPTKPAASKSRP
jgi:predicted transcriptional regulator